MANEFVTGNAEEDGRSGDVRGWFVGHFLGPEAGLRQSSAVEVKWGIHAQHEEKRSGLTNLHSTTLTLLVSGLFVVKFPALGKAAELRRPGDYVLFAPGVEHDWVAREASVVVTVRWPSVIQTTASWENDEGIAAGRNLLAKVCADHSGHDANIMQGIQGEYLHALDVLDWVHKLRPDAPTYLSLAALFHDIDRVITRDAGGGFKGNRHGPEYALHKKRHANRSASFIAPHLRELGLRPEVVDRATFLIVHHDDTGEEVAAIGDCDLDCLVAADSFAFFTSIAPKLYALEGESRTRDKIRFMIEKLPADARSLLRKHQLSDDVFERLKNETMAEYDALHGLMETLPTTPSS